MLTEIVLKEHLYINSFGSCRPISDFIWVTICR